MNRTIELMDACRTGNEDLLVELGWRPVIDALRAWPKRLDGQELTPYVSLLGDHEPDKVAAAINALAASKYRPGAAEVYARMLAGNGPPATPPVGGPRTARPRPDQTPEALEAVLEAVAAGELICECIPRPADVIADYWHVLRCPDCDGLEVGQYEAALEAGS